MVMNGYLFWSILIAIAFAIFLHYKHWKIKHIISIIIGFIFVYLFSSYGQSLFEPIFPNISGAWFFVLMFFLIYIGGAVVSSLPFIIHGDFKKQKKKIINIFKLLIVFGLIYTAVDNFTMGPFAVGPHSAYVGKSLCGLDATYYSEDVFAGCILEKLGINTTSALADFLTYNIFSLFLIVLAGWIISFRRLESLIYPEK